METMVFKIFFNISILNQDLTESSSKARAKTGGPISCRAQINSFKRWLWSCVCPAWLWWDWGGRRGRDLVIPGTMWSQRIISLSLHSFTVTRAEEEDQASPPVISFIHWPLWLVIIGPSVIPFIKQRLLVLLVQLCTVVRKLCRCVK